MNEYVKQATDFLAATNTTLSINFISTVKKDFVGRTAAHDTYQVTLSNSRHTYSFVFTDSINNTEKNAKRFKRVKPTAYDILACLSVNEFDSFDDFCQEFGYEYSSEREQQEIQKIYYALLDESENIQGLWTSEELEELHEIN